MRFVLLKGRRALSRYTFVESVLLKEVTTLNYLSFYGVQCHLLVIFVFNIFLRRHWTSVDLALAHFSSSGK